MKRNYCELSAFSCAVCTHDHFILFKFGTNVKVKTLEKPPTVGFSGLDSGEEAIFIEKDAARLVIMLMDLAKVREKIDAIDREIMTRLNERVRLASEVAHAKAQSGLPIYMPEREEQVFRKLDALNEGPLTPAAIRHIYREIISAMIALERPLAVAYLGPEGTYTEQAARKNFGSSLGYRAYPIIADVFAAVERGEADYGVIPIENSTGGAVIHSLDMMAETDLKIVAQVYLPVEHCLLSQSSLSDITEVHSKDQALIQCRDWLQRNLPNARQVDADSTAQAVKKAASQPGMAAIAGALASERYGVPIVAQGIQDRMDNETRFFVIGPQANLAATGPGLDRTSIVFSIRDEVGALERAVHTFSSRSINLSKIESRPSRRKAWDYLFFVDFAGHWSDPVIQEAVEELRVFCPMVKWLGSYPNSR